MTDIGDMPPDPLPATTPHRLMVFGRKPDGTILVACLDCNGEIVGEAEDRDGALDVTAAHAREMGY